MFRHIIYAILFLTADESVCLNTVLHINIEFFLRREFPRFFYKQQRGLKSNDEQIEIEGNKIFDDVNRNNVNRDNVNRGNTVADIFGFIVYALNNI